MPNTSAASGMTRVSPNLSTSCTAASVGSPTGADSRAARDRRSRSARPRRSRRRAPGSRCRRAGCGTGCRASCAEPDPGVPTRYRNTLSRSSSSGVTSVERDAGVPGRPARPTLRNAATSSTDSSTASSLRGVAPRTTPAREQGRGERRGLVAPDPDEVGPVVHQFTDPPEVALGGKSALGHHQHPRSESLHLVEHV